jgi:hypothetical protein
MKSVLGKYIHSVTNLATRVNKLCHDGFLIRCAMRCVHYTLSVSVIYKWIPRDNPFPRSARLAAFRLTCVPSSTTMSIQLLGYADSNPCNFVVDRASPTSQVSTAFLFRTSLHCHLDSTGCQYARLTISVPSQGGVYTSTSLHLLTSATCAADVVLGADWLAACRVTTAVNVLLAPSQETVQMLSEGHRWSMNGTPCISG